MQNQDIQIVPVQQQDIHSGKILACLSKFLPS